MLQIARHLRLGLVLLALGGSLYSDFHFDGVRQLLLAALALRFANWLHEMARPPSELARLDHSLDGLFELVNSLVGEAQLLGDDGRFYRLIIGIGDKAENRVAKFFCHMFFLGVASRRVGSSA